MEGRGMPDPTFEGLGFFYASADMFEPEKAARRRADKSNYPKH